MKTIIKITALFILFLGMTACHKDGSSYMRVKMKDVPGDYEKVLVDIQRVEVHFSSENDSSKWMELQTNAGIYDLLTLQNGITTILANDTELPSGSINQLRLILGTNNAVVIDSIAYPLKTPSAQQSGLKLNINAFLESNKSYDVLIDFDAEKSIVLEGNGTFLLKPKITVESIYEY